MELIRKSDAIRAVLHNTGDAAVAAVQEIKAVDPFDGQTMLGYPMRELLLFAEACRREQITERQIRDIAKDITFGMTFCRNEMERAWREATAKMVATAHVPSINLERFGIDVNEWLRDAIRKEQADDKR